MMLLSGDKKAGMKMNKKERIKAALTGAKVDRPPAALWMHYPGIDQDPEKLAQAHADFQAQYDFDFIKLTPFEYYSSVDWNRQALGLPPQTESPVLLRPSVEKSTDWARLKPLSPTGGAWGQQLRFLRRVKELVQPGVPLLQTVYSPLTVAKKLAGAHLAPTLRENPKVLHRALEAIADTTMQYIEATLKNGADGIFYALDCANHGFLTTEEFATFGHWYDMEVLKVASAGWFNVLHIHGQGIMFDEVLDYPVQALNWHDSHAYPSIAHARKKTDLCFIGGLDETGPIVNGAPSDVIAEVAAFLNQTDLRRVMLGPGCATSTNAPDKNIGFFRLVVEQFADKNIWRYLSGESASL